MSREERTSDGSGFVVERKSEIRDGSPLAKICWVAPDGDSRPHKSIESARSWIESKANLGAIRHGEYRVISIADEIHLSFDRKAVLS